MLKVSAQLTVLVALALSLPARATQWTVSNSAQAPAQFMGPTALQDAIAFAANGDTLLVTGTGTTYGTVVIDKALVLIGMGYSPAAQATIVADMDIRSSGVRVTGFSATGWIFLNANNAPGQELVNVHVSRSMGAIHHVGSNTLGSGLFSNVSVTENVLGAVRFGWGFTEHRFVFDTLIYSNNIISGRFAPYNVLFIEDYIGTNTIILDHNNFLGNGNNWGALWSQFQFSPGAGWPGAEMVVSNNIFRGTGPRGCDNCCFINNMTYGAGPEDNDTVLVMACDTVNFWGVDPGIPGGTYNMGNDYTLPLGSPAIGTASDGSDIGITGGSTPLAVGERPLGPKVYTLDIIEAAIPPDSLFHYSFLAHSNVTPTVFLDGYEYIFDTDQGVGSGASTMTLSDTLDLVADGLASGLTLGTHLFGVRARDEQGLWSHTKWQPIYVCETYGAEGGFNHYRSGSTVSFVEHSQYATSMFYDFGDGQTDTTWNPLHQYDALGNYTVTQIATNDCAGDTVVHIARISGLNDYTPHIGGNAGFCTIQMNGMNFVPDMTVTLYQGGSPVLGADTVYRFSMTNASAVLNLLGLDAGIYDLEIVLPGDTTMFIPNGFEIQDAGEAVAVEVQWIAPSIMRTNRARTVVLRLTNSNLNDVLAAPVWIAYSDDISIEFADSIIEPVFSGSDTLPSELTVDHFLGEPFAGKLTALLIGRIPGSGFIDIPIRITSSQVLGTAKLRAWVSDPLLTMDGVFQMAEADNDRDEGFSSWACMSCFLNAVPGLGCTANFAATLLTPFITDVVNSAEGKSQFVKQFLRTAIACGSTAAFVLTGGGLGAPSALGVSLCLALNNCVQPASVPANVSVSSSYDPNEKNGPSGVAESGFLPSMPSLSYKIAFENLDTAALPAQRIVIVDTLDASVFDIRTATLGVVGLADSIITCESLSRTWTAERPLPGSYVLRLNAAIDTVNAVVTWDFFMVDTLTDALPADPLAGFLPPNATSPEGEGFVTLILPLRTDLPHGQVIQNSATILFDENAPIVTNTWLNTLDLLPPTSQVDPLPSTTTDTLVQVSWTGGTDAGSGIARYYVYASADTTIGYDLWLVTGETSGVFDGENGITYHFYVVAEDSVGNMEVKTPTSEAQTFVDFSTAVEPIIAEGGFVLFPNPTTGAITLVGKTDAPCILQVEVRNTVGQVLEQRSIPTGSGDIRLTLDLPELAMGTYIATVKCADLKLVERLIKITE